MSNCFVDQWCMVYSSNDVFKWIIQMQDLVFVGLELLYDFTIHVKLAEK